MSEKRFKNQVVMITGAGGGIGKAIAASFAKEGAILVLTDVDPKKRKLHEL